jgi:hypothetical protein
MSASLNNRLTSNPRFLATLNSFLRPFFLLEFFLERRGIGLFNFLKINLIFLETLLLVVGFTLPNRALEILFLGHGLKLRSEGLRFAKGEDLLFKII